MPEEGKKKIVYSQFNVRLPDKLHKEFKKATVDKDESMAGVVRGWMEKYLADMKRPVIY